VARLQLPRSFNPTRSGPCTLMIMVTIGTAQSKVSKAPPTWHHDNRPVACRIRRWA
jgi:hypothetical protein